MVALNRRLAVNSEHVIKTIFISLMLTFSVGVSAQALYVAPSGDVGVGTDTPTSALHILRNDQTARLLIEETTDVLGPKDLFEI